ncbi:MAG: hypothetical protein IIU14_05105 [Ruminococcus sp.]|nr:hypothetical protein [Ruminococcus sp.]
MKKKLAIMPTAVFLCIVYVMAAVFVFTPDQEFSSSEKRYLDKFPEANVNTVFSGEFENNFEHYFADQFPLRKLWVGINSYSKNFFGNFQSSERKTDETDTNNQSEPIYRCADDYLINIPIPTDNQLERNLSAITRIKEQTKLPVTVTFAPSTGYIMDDVLPYIHEKYNDDAYFNTAAETLKKAGVKFVDLRERFKTEKNNGNQLYYRTDHHWTTYGAYTAYTELADALKYEAYPKSQYKIESYGGFYGTTYSSSGFWLNRADDIELWRNKDGEKKTLTITEGSDKKSFDSLYFKDHLNEDDKYPVFVDGNHAVETIVNKNVKSGKLLVVKDSFCHCLAPFLSDNFNTVTMVDMRYFKTNVASFAEKGKYDSILVVYGIDNFAKDMDFVWAS